MAYTDEVLADAPAFYWRLEETTGTVAADSSGNARTGTISGTPTMGAAGLVGAGTAFTFDGTNDRISRPGFNNPTSFTVEAWFQTSYSDAGNERQLIASRLAGAGNTGKWRFAVDSSTGVLQFDIQTSAGWVGPIVSGVAVNDGQPHHAVAVVSSATLTVYLYLDGVEVATIPWNGVPHSINYEFFVSWGERRTDLNILPFDGVLDEIAYYETALPAARVAAHYEAGGGGPAAVTGSLAGSAPAVTGAFTAEATIAPITGSLAGAAPGVTGNFAGTTTVPPVSGTLAGTAPAVTGSFRGNLAGAVTGTLGGTAPGVFGDFAGSFAEAPPEPVDTSTKYANDSYGYDGMADVYNEPAIEPTPAHIPRAKVMQVHQSMSAPNLVNGVPR